MLVATSSSGSPLQTPKRGNQLTLGITVPPVGLNPAKVGPGAQVAFLSPAYDSYIYQAADGSFRPGLAASFGYASGSSNSTFTMTLRRGLRYADGTPLNAANVVHNLTYQKGAGFATSSLLQPFKTIQATGPLKVKITTIRPVAGIPLLLSQFYPTGFPISEAGLADPRQLDTRTFGIGPYVLNPSATVPGSVYTYTANPRYHNQAKIYYRRFVIRVISDSNALLQALKTGQVDVMSGSARAVPEAKRAKIQVKSATARNVGLWLLDRSGQAEKAMGDVRVRRALNFAVDRRAVTRALVGEYGTPTAQPANEGLDGFDPTLERVYPFNAARARQLLSQAGYAEGFPLSIVTVTPGVLQAQAIAGYLERVGVKVSYVNDDTFRAQLSGRYPVMILSYAGPMEVLLNLAVRPTAPANVFKSTNPNLQALVDQYGLANAAGRARIGKQITKFLVDNAWFLPVYNEHAIWFARPNVAGVQVSAAWTFLDPKEWRPAS
jgi:peptide/nickel transport system substrate-binding protein